MKTFANEKFGEKKPQTNLGFKMRTFDEGKEVR
jgi:hypothetical protein